MSKTNHSKVSIYDFFYANKTRKAYTMLGISLILIIILVVFALLPTIKTIGRIRENISVYKELNDTAETKIKASQNLQTQQNTTSEESPDGLKNEINFMNKVFFHDYSIESLYLNIKERAEKNGVRIVNIDSTYEVEGSSVNSEDFDSSSYSPSTYSYGFDLSIQAKDTDDLFAFIKSIEGPDEFPVFARIADMSITDHRFKIEEGGGDEKPKEYLDATMKFIIYLDETRYAEGGAFADDF